MYSAARATSDLSSASVNSPQRATCSVRPAGSTFVPAARPDPPRPLPMDPTSGPRIDERSRATSDAAVSANCSSGHRRNGLPALTCSTTSGASWGTPADASAASTRRRAPSVSTMFTGRARARRGDAERRRSGPTDSRPNAAPGARAADRSRACTSSSGRQRCSQSALARRSATSTTSRAGRRESRSPHRTRAA